MILPEHLSPLPVRPGEGGGATPEPLEDFVSSLDVRRVLLGTGDLPVEGLPSNDFDSFAGRADVTLPGGSRSPFASGAERDLSVPDMEVETPVVHPAFEVLPPQPRRAAPPRASATIDCESSFGGSRRGDRGWVLWMGLAAAAVLISATLVDTVSREAIRRSRAGAPLDVIHVVPGQAVPTAEQEPGESFAATLERELVE